MNKNTSHYRRRKATHVHTNVQITRKMEMENTRKHLARKDNIQTKLKEVTPIPALKLTKNYVYRCKVLNECARGERTGNKTPGCIPHRMVKI